MRHLKKIRSILLAALFWTIACSGSFAQSLRDPGLDVILDKIKAHYGINIHYADAPQKKFVNLNYNLADLKDKTLLKKIVLIFVQEISRYPKDFFRAAQCEDIYFVQKLFFKEKPVEGLFSERTKYIFYDYARTSRRTEKMRHNIHHELYHLIASKHPFWVSHAQAWESFNRAGFNYDIKTYSPHEHNPVNFFAPPELGFITPYAMASAEEDRAEVFTSLMVPEEKRLLEQWSKKDEILLKKMALMKEFLKTIK